MNYKRLSEILMIVIESNIAAYKKLKEKNAEIERAYNIISRENTDLVLKLKEIKLHKKQRKD